MKHREVDDATRLRDAFSTGDMQRAPDGCPSDEELWASAAGELDPGADEAVILHLARCSECSTAWMLAREMLPLDHLPGAKVVSIRDRIRLQNWPKVVLPVAAAILIGVGLSTGLLLRNEPSSPPVFRQQQDEDTIAALPETRLLSRTDCRLRWTAGPSGARYDLLVTDGELEVLSTVKGLKEPEYTLPREEIPASSDELFWRVTAHLPDGRTLSSETFTTGIDDPASEPNR